MNCFVPLSKPLPSRANARQHWRAAAATNATQRQTACAFTYRLPRWYGKPIVVTLTRIASRKLDGDNLQTAFKSIRDGVADGLFRTPGKGNDRDPRIEWRYAEEPAVKRNGRYVYGYTITIEATA